MTLTALPTASTSRSVWSVAKSANTTKNNDATVADDPHLTIANVPIGTYAVRAFLKYESSTAADFKAGLTATSGASASLAPRGLISTATTSTSGVNSQASYALANTPPLGGVGAGTQVGAELVGTLTLTTAGTVTVKWAQNTADATDTILYADSWLILTKLG